MRKKGGKSDTMRFASEFAREVVTETLRYQTRFATDQNVQRTVFNFYTIFINIFLKKYSCQKQGWSDRRNPVTLEVAACSLNQLDPHINTLWKSYDYKEIRMLITLKGHQQNAFIIELGDQRRRVSKISILM